MNHSTNKKGVPVTATPSNTNIINCTPTADELQAIWRRFATLAFSESIMFQIGKRINCEGIIEKAFSVADAAMAAYLKSPTMKDGSQ